MDIEKLRDLIESIELTEDVTLAISTVSDQQLGIMAQGAVEEMLTNPSSTLAGFGALLAIGMEAAERSLRSPR